jgi:hypothetical protein
MAFSTDNGSQSSLVRPAKAGVHERAMGSWIPAFAGMTTHTPVSASNALFHIVGIPFSRQKRVDFRSISNRVSMSLRVTLVRPLREKSAMVNEATTVP